MLLVLPRVSWMVFFSIEVETFNRKCDYNQIIRFSIELACQKSIEKTNRKWQKKQSQNDRNLEINSIEKIIKNQSKSYLKINRNVI